MITVMRFKYWVLLLVCAVLFAQCIDDNYDEPPTGGSDPEFITESDLVSMEDVLDLWTPGQNVEIGLNKYLKAVVAADDQSGNFYKTLVLQEGTSGISIIIDDVEMYNTYFEGRRVFVDLSNLWISDFNGLPQLGGAPDAEGDLTRIPQSLASKIVLPGSFLHPLEIQTLNINQLGTAALNTLVRLENVQFAGSDRGATFADAEAQQSVNRTLEDCQGGTVLVRTSGFASFAGEATPEGNGTLIGIYSIFGDDKQFLVRDPDDLDMAGSLCSEVDPVDVDPADIISIADVLSQWVPGDIVNIGQEKYIEGTVIADDRTGNFFKQLIIQEGDDGINVQLDDVDLFVNFPVGSKVYVDLRQLSIGDFNGTPQLGIGGANGIERVPENLVPQVVLRATGDAEPISPKEVNISDLGTSNLNTLITINEVEFVDGDAGNPLADAENLQSRNLGLQDCDENRIIVRSSGYSDFADINTPTGNGRIVAVYSVFGEDEQLTIRTTDDLIMPNVRCDGTTGGDGGGGGDDEGISEDFENLPEDADLALDGWINVTVKGNDKWLSRAFGGNGFAEIEGYQVSSAEMESWLLTPAFDPQEFSTLNFESSMAFWQHDGFSVWISTDFSGDVTTATWDAIECNLPTENNDFFEFVDSGDIDLSGYSGEARVAFKYVGDPATNTTKIQLDNLSIK